jgi:hypothetical protein
MCASIQGGKKEKDDVAASASPSYPSSSKASSNHSYVLTWGWIRFIDFSQVVTSTGGGMYEN